MCRIYKFYQHVHLVTEQRFMLTLRYKVDSS